ncbi:MULTISPECIES: NTP transferase domain-containing protein [Ferrimicrobium]|uniref:NTP transferase domain-containing protein n=1 Tax=Ferrimicrobium acidiphilum TaxID=121039 RepID=A0ABV3Y5C4_9ACTN|nr:NTP transferase domain-containing protein [Ferrimicrobium sp.]MCL5974190.1 NTP transferase domain-containing protein [Actinomycetota bacterium]
MALRFAMLLAAGKGTRMASERPKPMMKLCGVSMLRHVMASVLGLDGLERVVVVIGHQAELVERELRGYDDVVAEVVAARQPQQRGTGDAVSAGLSRLPDLLPGVGGSGSEVLVLPADTPLITTNTLEALANAHAQAGNVATILTMEVQDPTGYGRIIRNAKGAVTQIAEDRDLVDDQRNIREVNTGIYVFDLAVLPVAIRRLAPTNSQREYYLTDTIGLLSQSGYQVGVLPVADVTETQGVNDLAQLVEAEEMMRQRIISRHVRAGVMMVRPETITIDAEVEIAKGSTIWPNTLLLGHTSVGSATEVGPGSRLVDTVVGDGTQLVNVDATGATIGSAVQAGPYVTIRDGVVVPDHAVIEPFSLVK